jgi:hypothetical protein
VCFKYFLMKDSGWGEASGKRGDENPLLQHSTSSKPSTEADKEQGIMRGEGAGSVGVAAPFSQTSCNQKSHSEPESVRADSLLLCFFFNGASCRVSCRVEPHTTSPSYLKAIEGGRRRAITNLLHTHERTHAHTHAKEDAPSSRTCCTQTRTDTDTDTHTLSLDREVSEGPHVRTHTHTHIHTHTEP